MSKLIDLTGQDFGYWHVIERAPNDKSGKAYWLCQCMKCKKTIKPVSGSHLRSGRSKACTKCRQKKMVEKTIKNEIGKTYGFLYVESKALDSEKPRNDRTGVYWNCTCLNCGRKNVIIFGDYLRNGDTKSCGCINSFNEKKICQMLEDNKIQYKTQISFQDLPDKKFDVGVYNQNILLYIIEYDGAQHFHSKAFNGAFSRTHSNDLIKNQYCFRHSIPIIRIPFDTNYSLSDLRIETTHFLLTPENEQSYYEKRLS